MISEEQLSKLEAMCTGENSPDLVDFVEAVEFLVQEYRTLRNERMMADIDAIAEITAAEARGQE